MADTGRRATDHLTVLRAVAEAPPGSHEFLGLLRRLEALAHDWPRFGESRIPSADTVELRHAPTLRFPERTIDRLEIDAPRRPRLYTLFLGMTGPMGPLPLHLSEFAFYEELYSEEHPFGDFLNLLTRRWLQLFFRAWADTNPAATRDRPAEDPFAGFVASLSGAREGARTGGAFPADARLYYAALFIGRRGASHLQDALSDLLRAPVTIREFVGRWNPIGPEDRSRLGGAFCTLGVDAVLGDRVWSVEDGFRVAVRARSQAEYLELLPSGRRFPVASEAIDAFAPGHLDWDFEIEIDESIVAPARLDGSTRLGWTGWVAPKGRAGVIRRDIRLRRGAAAREARRAAKGQGVMQ